MDVRLLVENGLFRSAWHASKNLTRRYFFLFFSWLKDFGLNFSGTDMECIFTLF